MIFWAAIAYAVPMLGEGPSVCRLQVWDTDQQIRAEIPGEGSFLLEKKDNAWEGEIHGEPRRFLQLRFWEGEKSLWEGTIPLTDSQSETLSFRVIDQAPGRPRHLARVASAAPLPSVGGLEGRGVFAIAWALLMGVAAAVGLRRNLRGN
jgi:hypothetical protein